jgi:hypothetical protein
VALGALLEPREGARGFGRRWKRAEVRVHRRDGNGGPAERCARVGMVELPFIGAGEAEGVCERCLEGREEELRGSRMMESVSGVRPSGRRRGTPDAEVPRGGAGATRQRAHSGTDGPSSNLNSPILNVSNF